MKNPFLIAILISTSTVSILRAADFDVSGLDTPADRIPVSARFYRWVQSMGYDANLSSDGEDVNLRDYKLKVVPFASTSGLDAIMVFNIYSGHPENVRNSKLQAEIAIINQEQANVHVSLKSNGDIMFISQLNFDDTLSPKLFRKYMEICNEHAVYILKRYPGLAACAR